MKKFSVVCTVALCLGKLAMAQHPFVPVGDSKWWNKDVFYEVFVRSFKDSDGDGDGDFKGLTSKLDYLQNLGITGIWLMPINASPSTHGYDVIDYKSVHPDYGTMADFDEFIAAAHKRNIKVIIDLVPNHTSNMNPWFVASATSKKTAQHDWYIWRDSLPKNITPVFEGDHPFVPMDQGNYYRVFSNTMPDINHKNVAVQNAFKDIIKFWLTDRNIDGYRVDAVRYLAESPRLDTLQDYAETFRIFKMYRDYMKQIKTTIEPFWVGEAWAPTSIASQYPNKNSFDFCFEFATSWSILKGLKENNPSGIGLQMDTVVLSYNRPNQYGVFLTNHDQDRIFSELQEDVPKMKMAAAIYLTLPGIPFMYYGEEIGMCGVQSKGLANNDLPRRSPMQWSANHNCDFTTGKTWNAIQPNYIECNVAKEESDKNSLLNWYKILLALRKQYEVLSIGNYQTLDVFNDKVLSYVRCYNKQVAIVVHNFQSTDEKNIKITTTKSSLPKGKYRLKCVLGSTKIPAALVVKDNGAFEIVLPKLAPTESIVLIAE